MRYADVENYENIQVEEPIDNILWIDSRKLALELGIKHVNMLILLRREYNNLTQFGELTECHEKQDIKGRPFKFYQLNKFHAMYLLCITKNSERVKQLRINFVKYFYKYTPNV